jgi:hypothetical protein
MTEKRPTLSIFPKDGAVAETPAEDRKARARLDAPVDPRRVALPPVAGARTVKHKATPAKAKHAWAETQLREALRAAATDETAPV